MRLSDKIFLGIAATAWLALVTHGCRGEAKEVRVFVADTGIDRMHMDLLPYVQEGNWDDMNDVVGHGTHIAGIIASANCPNLKIISCKAFYKDAGAMDKMVACFRRALTEHIDIVNFSGGGSDPDDREYQAIKAISDAGIKIVTAAGNDNRNLGSPCYGFFPACYALKNEFVIGALTKRGNIKLDVSNYGMPGMNWEIGESVWSTFPSQRYAYMTGTSQATATFTKHLVQDMCYR
jgi:subtilisin family serine protease